ncbi:MAG: molybdopterin molybdotransferase MoeA [Proteobacteria bacterium]|nr:molybdopterin molybdotransferase MoeA [Pseudomonadota bacterium]
MAQLKDDCFAFGGQLTPLAVALDDLMARLSPVTDAETVPIRVAANRILAEDVISDRNVPPEDNSAVDGYAVAFKDLNADGDTRLPASGRVAAGHPLGRPANTGEAIRIFTGAPMPDGMDTVFMEEDCRVDGEHIILPPGLKLGSNRRFAGEDVKAGTVIVAAGARLRAQEVGLAASVGRSALSVRAPLRVGVFSTGDEVRDPGADAPAGSIYDANRFTVMALLDGLGCQVTDLGILPDDADVITAALAEAATTQDLLMTSGGVSAGEEDHVKTALSRLGSLHFWRLAIKPGRPIALGQIGGTAFVGLPGNPVAAMVTFLRVAQPIIRKLAGERHWALPAFPVRADFKYKKKIGRREWVRVRLERDQDGLVARKPHSSGAGILTSLVDADGLVELPEDMERVEPGTAVAYFPFSGMIE